jgi:hypothetical protein
MPLNAFITYRPLGKAYPKHCANPGLPVAPASDVVPAGEFFHRWTLGFRQSGFSLIVQALRSGTVHAFRYPPRYQHALVPLPFRA